MLKSERQKLILQYLQEHGTIDTQTICERFDVVPMTARRDLSDMAARGQVRRTHGGAVLLKPSLEADGSLEDAPLPTMTRLKEHAAEKEAIARAAFSRIEQGQHIFLSGGTTVHTLAGLLAEKENLQVVTDAVNITYELTGCPNINLIALGGEVRHNALTMTGKLAEHNLKYFQFDSAFIGINGISTNGAMYISTIAESAIIQTICERVPHVYFLADSSKVGNKDFVYICDIGPGHTLITTPGISADAVRAYEARGAEVIIAE